MENEKNKFTITFIPFLILWRISLVISFCFLFHFLFLLFRFVPQSSFPLVICHLTNIFFTVIYIFLNDKEGNWRLFSGTKEQKISENYCENWKKHKRIFFFESNKSLYSLCVCENAWNFFSWLFIIHPICSSRKKSP